jgi:hypothetical protein
MARANEYRNYAAECVRLAQQACNQNDKALLLEMAENWRDRAAQIELKEQKSSP